MCTFLFPVDFDSLRRSWLGASLPACLQSHKNNGKKEQRKTPKYKRPSHFHISTKLLNNRTFCFILFRQTSQKRESQPNIEARPKINENLWFHIDGFFPLVPSVHSPTNKWQQPTLLFSGRMAVLLDFDTTCILQRCICVVLKIRV